MIRILKYPILIFIIAGCGGVTDGDGGEIIAFIHHSDIVVYNIDTHSTRIVADNGAGFDVRWSHNGEYIAYTGQSLKGWESHQIYIVNAQGNNLRPVTVYDYDGNIIEHGGGGRDPVWSPTDERIAFTRCVNCEMGGVNSEVFCIDVDYSSGINEIQLTDNLYHDSVLDWSIADNILMIESDYTISGEYDEIGDVYFINTDGTNKQLFISCDSEYYVRDLRFSHNGDRVAYKYENNMYILSLDSMESTAITTDGIYKWGPSWSPDDDTIMYIAGSHATGGNIVEINISDLSRTQITNDSGYWGVDWRPN